MTFVAAPPATPAPAVADAIAGDGWYPALSIAAFRDAMRITTMVTDGRARDALVAVILSAAIPLAGWRVQRVADGIATLAGVPVPAGQPVTIGDEARSVVLWRRAVHSFAAAGLVDTHSDIGSTEAGRHEREMKSFAAVEQLRRDATSAIRDLLGRTRSKVVLV